MLHQQTAEAIISAFYQVYNTLGYGFLEKIYENALVHELTKQGWRVQPQWPIQVYYDGLLLGDYVADLLVEECVIVELKAVDNLHPQHVAQLLNYLKATHIEVGLLLNFGPKPTFERKIFTNDRKNNRTRINTDKTDFRG
jgi:GxxExxY protein